MNIQEPEVILVNEKDEAIGKAGKLEAHKNALLHRAFSIFIFNDDGELMLQQRAAHKYHSPLLWTNTCCSHPNPYENLEKTSMERLKEEMGFTCELNFLFKFLYKVDFENGLTEHEYDYVLIGKFNGVPKLNPNEAIDWKWAKPEIIKQNIEKNPEEFTYWFKMIFEKVCQMY